MPTQSSRCGSGETLRLRPVSARAAIVAVRSLVDSNAKAGKSTSRRLVVSSIANLGTQPVD